jgi:hypothetical protein
MAARGDVIDTSAFKGIADLHAEVLSNDSVVAPAHAVVQDSDLIADYSMPPAHADAAPEHSGDVAATSTENATAEDTGHVHAELAYADVDHAYADHAVADIDHAYADHAFADHAFADAAAPDSAFTDHSILAADDGTPHSFGADAAKGQDDGSSAAAWWWVGGAALAAGALGYWAGDDHHDDATSATTTASPDVHVVVESTGAYIDTNGDGVHQSTELDVANFGHGGNADLAADSVTVHFNDVPTDVLNLTGFSADDKIEFHVEAMMGNNSGHNQVLDAHASYLVSVGTGYSLSDVFKTQVSYEFKGHTTSAVPLTPYYHYTSIDVIQHRADIGSTINNAHESVYALSLATHAVHPTVGAVHLASTFANTAPFAYWTDAGNALNNVALLLPHAHTGSGAALSYAADLNANNEGGVVDFIWPATIVT